MPNSEFMSDWYRIGVDSNSRNGTLADKGGVYEVPVDSIVPEELCSLVIGTDSKGNKRINRIPYELCLLQVLRNRLRCKEICVEGVTGGSVSKVRFVYFCLSSLVLSGTPRRRICGRLFNRSTNEQLERRPLLYLTYDIFFEKYPDN